VRAYIGNVDLLLTQKEFAVLLQLVENEGKSIKAETLFESVWKRPVAGNENLLQATISRLRKKIDRCEYTITVIRSEGYIFMKI
jgi:DNA-binding response OmpR family regulator